MKKIFFNEQENRLRAGWRITILSFLIMLAIFISATLSPFDISYSLFLAILVMGILWFASKAIDKRSFSDYGFHAKKSWVIKFLAGNAMAAVAIGIIVAIQLNMDWMEYESIRQPEISYSLVSDLIYWILIMGAVSIWEEAYFRSYLIANLKEGMWFKATGAHGATLIAVLVSALFFGLSHLGNPNSTWISTLNITIAGMVLAYPYIVTKSVAISVGMHLSWNYFQGAVFGLPVSGQEFDQSLMIAQVSGPEAFTGGSFGPEAGAAGLLGLMVLLILCEVYFFFFSKT